MQGPSTRSFRIAFGGPGDSRRPSGLWRPIAWLGGVVAGGAALALGAVLAVFTAAAVAVIALFTSVLIFFTSLAMRARRRAHATPGGEVIEARKVGHQWVAYGWDRQPR